MTTKTISSFCFIKFNTAEVVRYSFGPLTQGQVDSLWYNLPTTGCCWVECGNLFAQEFEDGPVFDCGPVEHGVIKVTEAMKKGVKS